MIGFEIYNNTKEEKSQDHLTGHHLTHGSNESSVKAESTLTSTQTSRVPLIYTQCFGGQGGLAEVSGGVGGGLFGGLFGDESWDVVKYIEQRKKELGIDLIQGNICPRKKRSRDEVWKRKLEKARDRLSRKEFCGSRGYLKLEVADGKVLRALYHPFSCGSVFCNYCITREARKVMGKYFDFFEECLKAGIKLSFVTLTLESEDDPYDAYQFASESLRKLYRVKLFSKRNWKKFERLFYDELKAFAKSAKSNKVANQERFFEDFKNRYKNLIDDGSRVELGQLFNALWKLEVTYSDAGWHFHWHGIMMERLPKLLLTVLWKYVTKNKGKIVDVRAVKGKKGIVELLKYTTKSWELDGSLSKEKQEELEAVLYGVKKVRHWGLDWLEKKVEEDEKEKEVKHYWYVRAYLQGKSNLSDLWEHVSKIRKEGKEDDFYCEVRLDLFYDYKTDNVEDWVVCDLYVNKDGELFIKDEKVLRLCQELYDSGEDVLYGKPEWYEALENEEYMKSLEGGVPDREVVKELVVERDWIDEQWELYKREIEMMREDQIPF